MAGGNPCRWQGNRQRLLLVCGLAWLLGPGVVMPASAGLPVLYDSGQTRPLAPLLAPMLPTGGTVNDVGPSGPQNPLLQPLLGPADIRNVLPIRSPGLYPGKLDNARSPSRIMGLLAQANPGPFFVVGSDSISLQWLTTHRERLKSLGAVGLLVQAETVEEVQQVVRVAGGLPMTLGSGTDLIAALGVDRYPVLITRQGLHQ